MVPIIQAFRELNLLFIHRMLYDGIMNPNAIVTHTTEIHELECVYKNVEIMKLLIRYGMDVNTIHTNTTPLIATPLTLCVMWGFHETAKLLIENGADINKSDMHSNTPLSLLKNTPALAKKEMISVFVKAGAKFKIHHIRDLDEPTFEMAVAEGGIDPNMKYDCEHIIFFYKFHTYIPILIKYGAYICVQNVHGVSLRKYLQNKMTTHVEVYRSDSDDDSEDDSEDESDSEDDSSDEEYEWEIHYERVVDEKYKSLFELVSQKLAGRRWVFVKCCVKWLAVHQRAVISANHPNRLKELGVFDCKDSDD